MKISGDVVKQLRLARGWTQEHLAAVSETSAKTIQRVESSGVCSLETRSALAAVFEVELAQLDGEARIEQAKASDGANGLMFYRRLTTGASLVEVFEGCWWYRHTHEDPRTREDVDVIAGTLQGIHDWSEIWGELEPGDKVKATYELTEAIRGLEAQGLWVFGLRTRATLGVPDDPGERKPPLRGAICNLHLAYANSESIIALDPKAGP